MKPARRKSKPVVTPVSPSNWYKLSFAFEDFEQCNQSAWKIASFLNEHFHMLYFARYTSTAEARLVVYFHTEQEHVQKHLAWVMGLLQKNRINIAPWMSVDGPAPCEGSSMHAYGFHFVNHFNHQCVIHNLNPAQRQELWCDVLHWMHNMAGFDYVDEARCNLYGLQKIISIFDQSIKMGNQTTWIKKKWLKKTKPTNPKDN